MCEDPPPPRRAQLIGGPWIPSVQGQRLRSSQLARRSPPGTIGAGQVGNCRRPGGPCSLSAREVSSRVASWPVQLGHASGGVPRPTVHRLPLYRRALAVMVEQARFPRLVDRARRGRRGEPCDAAAGPFSPRLVRDIAAPATRSHDCLARSNGRSLSTGTGRSSSSASETSGAPLPVRRDSVREAFASPPSLTSIKRSLAARLAASSSNTSSNSKKRVDSEQIEIGVIATPAGASQSVAERLISAGVRSILNFAPAVLSVPNGVVVRQVDLSAELQVLAFYQSRPAGTASLATAPGGTPGRTRGST